MCVDDARAAQLSVLFQAGILETLMNKRRSISTLLSSDIGILMLLVLARILLQVFTHGKYSFHQDELVT